MDRIQYYIAWTCTLFVNLVQLGAHPIKQMTSNLGLQREQRS